MVIDNIAMPLLRNIGSVICGQVIGSCVNMSIILLNSHVLYPMPAGVTFDDRRGMAEYIQSLPVPAFLVVFAAHLAQTVVGGYVAARLGGDDAQHPLLLAHISGGLTLLGSVVNNLQLPVPLWTWIELPFHPVLAHLVGLHVAKTRAKRKKE